MESNQQDNDAGTLEVVTIPAELEQYRDAVNAGLFYLAMGATPAEVIPAGAPKSVRIRISAGAQRYFESQALRFGSKRQAVIQTLAWVAAQDSRRQALLVRTII